MAVLQELKTTLELTPKIIWFGENDTKKERKAIYDRLTEIDQTALKILLAEILEDVSDRDNIDDNPLYYMATAEETKYMELEDSFIRAYSPDWRLIILKDKTQIVYDFNGWPGDNENGGGLLYKDGQFTKLFLNGDRDLVSLVPEYESLIDQYEDVRPN